MRLRNRIFFGCLLTILLGGTTLAAGNVGGSGAAVSVPLYQDTGDDAGSWPRILSSAGLVAGVGGSSGLYIARSGEAAEEERWREKIESGALLILEGDSELAAAFGFRASENRIPVRNVEDAADPELEIVWEKQLELPVFDVPDSARVFARERWTRSPLVAGFRQGRGGVLWVVTSPGEKGHERFPYLLNALCELGLEPPFLSRRLWAFYDGAYRSRVDLSYFARRWREAGISALHVAAWHHFEPNEVRDARLHELIEQCHRNAIQVYAWLELPHVSEQFWLDHPNWREKTAILQDAHLDWRKLMNLSNPYCARLVAKGLHTLIDRFDWDGVNLAELYFESLEGPENPARFTPMNDTVRAEFQKLHGADPLDLFANGARADDGELMRTFLDYRADLARRLQEHWIGEIQKARQRKPDMALVLTHVDDRFDTRMRDLIGADTGRLLPLLNKVDFTFLVEDPATVWNEGPERYPKIAEQYAPVTPRPSRLAIDINIVERYQNVYPTKQQTGTELLRQVHLASVAFPRVALYAEHSLLRADLRLLTASAAAVRRAEHVGGKLVVDSVRGVGLRWKGGALVDGRAWPVQSDRVLWLPAGAHSVERCKTRPHLRLIDFNGRLDTATATRGGLDFSYQSQSRAFAVLSERPGKVEVDGFEEDLEVTATDNGFVVSLPRGQHLVSIGTRSLDGVHSASR